VTGFTIFGANILVTLDIERFNDYGNIISTVISTKIAIFGNPLFHLVLLAMYFSFLKSFVLTSNAIPIKIIIQM
jgi:hypothetical protein